MIQITISNGEAFDRLTILARKIQSIDDPDKLMILRKQFDILEREVSLIYSNVVKKRDLDVLVDKLQLTNDILWEIEDTARVGGPYSPADMLFDIQYYNKNRHMIKREIDRITGDMEFTEQKSEKWLQNENSYNHTV